MALDRYKKKKGRKKKFSNSFKEHLRIGISAAVGFVIAFAWREPLILGLNNFILKYIHETAVLQASIISALIVTAFGVGFIYFVSRYLR